MALCSIDLRIETKINIQRKCSRMRLNNPKIPEMGFHAQFSVSRSIRSANMASLKFLSSLFHTRCCCCCAKSPQNEWRSKKKRKRASGKSHHFLYSFWTVYHINAECTHSDRQNHLLWYLKCIILFYFPCTTYVTRSESIVATKEQRKT